MQVQHFFRDPVPSVRNPLDSIALSPDSMKFGSYHLQDVQSEFSDFQSVLPSPNSCLLHGDGECRKGSWLSRWIRVVLKKT